MVDAGEVLRRAHNYRRAIVERNLDPNEGSFVVTQDEYDAIADRLRTEGYNIDAQGNEQIYGMQLVINSGD